MRPMIGRLRKGEWVLLAQVAALVVIASLWMGFSLDWRIQHDAPLLFYVAFLMERFDMVPYRDVFETSFPGVFVLHRLISAVFGYSDQGLALFNALYFLALSLISGFLLRPFGWRVALSGPAIFALIYFGHGQFMTLQRDYLAILPIALALAFTVQRRWAISADHRAFGMGVLFGLAASIKPQFGVGAFSALAYLVLANPVQRGRWPGQLLRLAVLAMSGGLVVMIPLVLWLWLNDALEPFLDMATGYLPLHLALNGEHQLLTAAARWNYYVDSIMALGGYGWLLPVASLGVWLCWRVFAHHEQRNLLMLLVSVAGLHFTLPIIAGQFWDYHWMPFAWSLSGLVGMALVADRRPARNSAHDLLVAVIVSWVLWFGAAPGWELKARLHGWPLTPPLFGRVDEIGAFLEKELQPGDTVQPLDWTSGAIHAMLEAKARLATRFLYDYHFYHQVDSPYIQTLRNTFLGELQRACPRFVIEVHDERHPKDFPGAPRFESLQKWLTSNYAVRSQADEYLVWERRDVQACGVQTSDGRTRSGSPTLRMSSSNGVELRAL
ncbi:MAG: hypothetical protein KDI42_10805 [Gammaproteobacteria bacterium]|nr:hypothetical protein [Gammaproteobacteria bacterium]